MAIDLSFATPISGWINQWNCLSRQLRRRLSERYSAIGLSESKVAILQALAGVSSNFTQSELASELGLSESSLCGLIERMRADGHLQRERSALDRRKSTLNLTAAGEELCRVVEKIHLDCESDFISQIPPELGSVLRNAVMQLSRSLSSVAMTQTSMRRAA